MNCDDIAHLSAVELALAIRQKKLSPVEVTGALLARIERLNGHYNAFCTVLAEEARQAASEAERAVMRGDRLPPLHGVPVSIKDNLWVQGSRTTFGSKTLEHNVAPADSPAAERLRAAGAVIVGRTNTPEFGWKGVTDNRVFGVSRNPWNVKLTPGGSSGGAAAAVAAGMGPIGIGTDGGGSLRIPASFCGVVGFKPSFGRVPNWPATTVDSLRHTGAITRTVADMAVVVAVLSGPDERDPASLPTSAEPWLSKVEHGIKGLRVAYSPNLGYAPVDPVVAHLARAAALRLTEAGAKVEEVELKWDDPFESWSTLFHGGIAAALADKLPKQGDLLDPGLRQIVEQGARLSAVDYVKAQSARNAFWQQVRPLYDQFDLLATPTLAVLPFAVGQDDADPVPGADSKPLHWTRFTYPFNLTGQPAISVPCGWTAPGSKTAANLPVGLQFVSRRFDDVTVLRAARAWEQLQPWADRCPPVP